MTKARARGALSVAFVVVALTFLVRRVSGEWPEVNEAFANASSSWLLAAVLLAGVAMIWMAVLWRSVLARLGSPQPAGDVVTWYFIGELGKYIPGGIFPLVGRAELARRGGVDRPVAYGSGLVSLALLYLSCGAIGGAAVVVANSSDWPVSLGVLATVCGGMLALHPRVLLALGTRVGPLARFLPPVPTCAASLTLVIGYVPAWLAVIASNAALFRALGTDIGVAELVAATLVSWYVGFLAVPFPGGLGVREAVFVALLTSVGGGVALAVAVGSRFAFVAVDLIGAALAAGVSLGREPRPSSTETALPPR